MSVKKGDFLTFDFTCKIKESGELVETTLADEAPKAGLNKGDQEGGPSFEPQFIIVGEGWVPKGLDDSFKGLKANDKKSFEIPPTKGYGERDPSKMKLLPLRKFTKEGVTPIPGMQVEIDRKPALVRSVGAGRVQIDFNHPLSGKTLIYNITIKRIIKKKDEQVKALIHRNFSELDLEKIGLTLKTKEKEVSIEMPEESFFTEGLQLKKRQIATALNKHIGYYTITFVEKFKISPPSKVSRKKSSDLSSKSRKSR